MFIPCLEEAKLVIHERWLFHSCMNPLIFILFVPFVFLTMTHNCTKETLKEYTIVEERKRKAGLFETRLLKNTAVTFSAIISKYIDCGLSMMYQPETHLKYLGSRHSGTSGFLDSLHINTLKKMKNSGILWQPSWIRHGGLPEVLCFRVESVYLLTIHNQANLAVEYSTG